MSIRIVLSTTIVFAVTGGALAQAPAPSAADGPWSGQVQCVLSARGPTYQDDQTHTWRITGGPPRLSGMFRQWPAVWSVEGRGGGSIIGGPATWVTSVPETSAPITIAEADGQIRISSQHGLLVANGGMNIVYTSRNQRSPASLEEWMFPNIETGASATTISETRSRPMPSYSRGWRQPADVITQETCTWNFSRGGAPTTTDTGRRGQPPELSRGGAAPPPTTVLPPPPPLTAGGPNTPPPGVAVPPDATIAEAAVPVRPNSTGTPPPPARAPAAPAPSPAANLPNAPDGLGRPGPAPADTGPAPAPAGGPAPTGRANSPVPTGNLAARLGGLAPPTEAVPATAPISSGTYLVTVTGLLAGAVTSDDPFGLIPVSTDGRGDEIYAAAFVRRYDRRSSQALEASSLQTFVYGDTNQAPDRQIAGSMTPLGGIRDLDKIPKDMSVARVAAAQEGIFPWRLWQGTLSDGVDALIISPSVWESDGSPLLFAPWAQNQNALTSSLLTRQQVLNQLNGRRFESFRLDPVAGAPVNNQALEIVLMLTTGTLGIPATVGLANAERFDRPIGLIRNGVDSTALANPVVVLTREIIEAALSGPSNMPIPTPTAGLIVVAPKPGIMVIGFNDGDMSNTGERAAAYYMVLQVERLDGGPPQGATPPTPGSGPPAPPPQPPPTQTADARPAEITTRTGSPGLLPPVLTNPPTTAPSAAAALPPAAARDLPGDAPAAAPAPCTLRGPASMASFQTPLNVYLDWQPVEGATGYRVFRVDGAELTRTGPLSATSGGLGMTRGVAGAYSPSYTVIALYPYGCGRTTIDTPMNLGVLKASAQNSTAGRVDLRWSVTLGIRPLSVEAVVVHVEGPGLPPGGVDERHVGTNPAEVELTGTLRLVGIPSGSQTWKLTSYWTTSPRTMGAEISTTVVVP